MNQNSARLNVLIVMFDHAAGFTTGPAGVCQTPHLDALAAEGRRFGRGYTTNAICSPARASLMTALYPSAHGMWDCTHTQRKEWVDVPAARFRYFSQEFDEGGYHTGYFGKWHVEQSEELRQFGWQEYETATLQLAAFSRAGKVRDEVVLQTPGYRDCRVAGIVDGPASPHPAFDRGIHFLQQHAAAKDDRPFCLFVSALEPHDPYLAPAEYAALYPPEQIELPPSLHDDCADKPEIVRRIQRVWHGLSDSQWRQALRCYRAVVTYLDQELGRIVVELKRLGLYENTIIVVTSDHGDMQGAHGLMTKGGGSIYEEVYRIPLTIRIPGIPAGGEDRQARVSLVDVAPTLLDYCSLPGLRAAQGRSLRPVLQGTAKAEDWSEAYAEFFGQRFVYTQRIVWHGDWKYVFSPGGRDELYHLAADPHERTNRIDDPSCRSILEECCRRMWRRMRAIGDESLFNSHYAILRTAPLGPLSVSS